VVGEHETCALDVKSGILFTAFPTTCDPYILRFRRERVLKQSTYECLSSGELVYRVHYERRDV